MSRLETSPSVAQVQPSGEPRARARTRIAPPGALLTGWELGLALGANIVLVAGLWLRAGGLAQDNALASLGRLTGLLGTLLVLVQLLLLARIPALERAVGFDRLTVWHRRNGRLAIGLLLAHAILITAGYAATAGLSLPAETSRLLLSTPGILTATAGTIVLVAVVFTSVVIVRRRLRYETWYFVHLYSYLGIALAFSHQLAVGKSFVGDPVARAYWVALYVVTAGALVAFRVLAPIARNLRHRMYVEEVVREGPGVVSIWIAGRDLHRLGVRAGQFFLWRFLTRDAWWQSHPFSLSAAPERGRMRITVKALGDFTETIASIRPGTRVMAEGPFGSFVATRRRRPRVALVAGGVGVTPIRALLDDLSEAEVTVLYRVVSDEDAVLADELRALAGDDAVHVLAGDHRDPAARSLLSADHLRRLVPDIARRDVFLCGPPAMADATGAALRAAGVPNRHIHVERFAY